MTNSGALLSVAMAFSFVAFSVAGGCLCHFGGELLRRWRQTRDNRARWMKVFLK